MKVTKLVILFNYKKLLLGLLVALIFFAVATQINSSYLKVFFNIFGIIIMLNIIASIIASYVLYDKSDLFKLNDVIDFLDISKIDDAVLIHASFDPISKSLENKYPNLKLSVCDIYGNRHEHESGIKISKKIFPPNPAEIKIDPSALPFKNKSQDLVIGVSAIHEILEHDKRVLFFQEAKRILKDDGLIIISEQFRDTTNFIFFNIGAFHFLSQNQWKKAILEAGLKIVKNRKITPFANMLVIKASDF